MFLCSFGQQQEEPDDDENVMNLEALKSRTTHTVSFDATLMIFFLFAFFGTDVNMYRFIYLFLISCQEPEQSSKPDNILESTVDATEWNLELERVLPQLKVTVRSDNKVKAAKENVFPRLLSVSPLCLCISQC